MFKMDTAGGGMTIRKQDLNKAMKLQDSLYSFDKFRYMCILSGCDYLASLPGIGLTKACKAMKMTRQIDIKLVSTQTYSPVIQFFWCA
jgi:exonuclease-1